MKQLLIAATGVLFLFSCKKEMVKEEETAEETKMAQEKEPAMHLAAEYKALSYTRAYGMHPKGGSKETADKPFEKGYSLVQLFMKHTDGPVTSAFVVIVNKDGGICGQDTIAVKAVSPDMFELAGNKIGSCPLNARTYIRISPADDQKQGVKVGEQAFINYDGPSAGVVDWIYYDYQTVVRTK